MKTISVSLSQYTQVWMHSLTTAVFIVATPLAGNLLAQNKSSAPESTNICLKTARDALASCKSAAESDYQVALGKCINITDPTARRSCEQQAASDRTDALDTCR